jgi:TonB family protein
MERSVSVPVYLAGENGGELAMDEQGSKAIEVIAMQGDEVEQVAHLTNPRSGQVSRATWAMLGSGAAAGLGALALFFATVAKEAAAKNAFDRWMSQGGEANRFVWPQVSVVLDLFAFALVVYAVVALLRGLRRHAEERTARDFTIGTTPGASCPVAAGLLPVAELPLVRARESGWDLVTCTGITGEIEHGLRRQPLVAGAVVPLEQDVRVVVDIGAHRFLVRTTARPQSHPRPILGGVRWDEQTYLLGSAMAHVLVLIGLLSVPRDAHALSVEDLPQIVAIRPVGVTPLVEDELKKQIDKVSGPGAKAGPTALKGAGPEGKAGSSKIKNQDGALRVKGPANNPDPAIAKSLAREMALSSGLLRQLGDHAASTTGLIWGRESALGKDAESNLGTLTALEPGDASGNAGLGLRGTGQGGGGHALGTVGLARIGISGLSSGQRGMGSRVGNFTQRHVTAGPDAVPGPPEVKGRLEKEIIRRIVRRHLNEVKYCYEQEAIRHQNIGGRLVVQFTIAGNGTVASSAVATSMGNATVDHCVADAVRRWEFPQPQGGGVVIVSYPFVLTLAGS